MAIFPWGCEQVWRPLTLVRHALLTVATELGRTLIIVVLLSCALGGIVFGDLNLAHRLRFDEQQRIADGLNVVIATAPGSIDATVCEGLSGHAGFRHAGSLREGTLAILASDGSTLVPTGSASTGLLLLWGQAGLDRLDRTGVLVGEAFARDQAMPPGSYLHLVGQSPHRLLGTIKEPGRAGRIAGWLVAVETAAGMTDACWAETEPGLRTNGEAVMRALFGSGGPVEVTTLTEFDDRSKDLVAEHDSRVPLALRWPIVLVVSLIAALSVSARRSEYGLCRALNMSPAHLVFTVQVEWMVYTLSAMVLGFAGAAIGIFFLWTQRSDVHLLWGLGTALTDLAAPLAASIVVAPVVAGLWRTDIASALKDR